MKKEKKEQLFEMQDVEGTAFRIIKEKDKDAMLVLGNVAVIRAKDATELMQRVAGSDTELMIMVAQAVYKLMVQLEIENEIKKGAKNE